MAADDKHDAAMKDATEAVNDIMVQYQKMGLNALTLMGGDLAERMSDMGAEMLDFFTKRVKADVELQHKLLHCRDLNEMQHLQAEYMQLAINHYTEESSKMFEMGTAFWMNGLSSLPPKK
ncbi:phasin family protein [Pseudodonghicola xiamenensis]|uniref:Phasin domain-containing protein n=1 Tax=Pseudodonghicola xiamenensis TaxID=337702 RepID=A0A8J3MC29_9RHOB|nr:phasin family protein [Pseudodonghicola xiamenensis]GHG87150.1 hypothetical protein GCM10010961_15360 [Pseudodonghicola xiamenensis]